MKKYRKGFYGILLLTLTMLFGMTAQAKTDDTIKTGIYAGDVELSGMTAQEATAVIEEHIEGLKDVEITLLAANDHDVTTTAGAVSYTHLDVYKRQRYTSVSKLPRCIFLFVFAWLVAFNIMTGLKNKNR